MNEQEKELIQDYKYLLQDYKLLTKDLRMLLSSVLGEEKEEENCNFVTLLKQPEKDVNSPEFEGIKKGVRQIPEYGEKYFFVNSRGDIDYKFWEEIETDLFRFNTGNCFKTEQEAEEYKENLLTKQQLKDLALELNNGVEFDWENDNQHKYVIYVDCITSKLSQCWGTHSKDFNIYCLNYDFIDIAKERIGEEKIIKLIKSGV